MHATSAYSVIAANGNGHSDILGADDARHAGMKDEVTRMSFSAM